MIQYDGVWCVQFLAVCSSGYNIVRIIESFAFYHREMRNLGRLEAIRRLKKKEGGKGWKRPDINNKTAIK